MFSVQFSWKGPQGNGELASVMFIVMTTKMTWNNSSLIRSFVNYYFVNLHRSFTIFYHPSTPPQFPQGPELSHSQKLFLLLLSFCKWNFPMGGRKALLNSLVAFRYSLFAVFSRQFAATPFHPVKAKVFGFVKAQTFHGWLCDGELTLFSSNTLNTNDANLLGSPCGKNCL